MIPNGTIAAFLISNFHFSLTFFFPFYKLALDSFGIPYNTYKKVSAMNDQTMPSGGRSLTPGYGFIHAFFWMAYAASTSYTSIYLLDAGFSNTQIGILIAAVSLLSAFLQPATASYADKPTSPSLKLIVIACCALFSALATILLFSGKRWGAVIIFCYGGLVMLNQLLIPLVNALGMQSINQGKNLNFGLARGCGSVAYAIATYIIGIAVTASGTYAAPFGAVLFSVLMILAVSRFPFEKVVTAGAETNEDPKKKSSPLSSLLYFFEHYRSFCYVLIGYVCICTCHMLINNFIYQIIATKGGGSAEAGTAMSLAAMAELPTMFFFGYLLKKASAATWYKTSAVFFVIKALLSLFAPNVIAFYGVQLLACGAWALCTVSSVYFVNSVMDKQDAIKGQACMTMAFTLGNVVSALIGGPMIDRLGITSTLIFSTIMGTIGMVIIWSNIKSKS